MVVDAEDQEQIRPLAGVEEEVCFKKDLTGPTLLEISDYQALGSLSLAVLRLRRLADFWGHDCQNSVDSRSAVAYLRGNHA